MTIKAICPVILITKSPKLYRLIDRYITDINHQTANSYQLIWNQSLEDRSITVNSHNFGKTGIFIVDLYYLLAARKRQTTHNSSKLLESFLSQEIVQFKQAVLNSELDSLIIVTDDCDTGIKTINAGASDYLSKQNLTYWSLERSLRLNLANIYLQQQQQQELEQKYQELARSNSDLEQFACIASHDLQAPLHTITNYAQLLELKYQAKLDNNASKYLNYIVDSAKKMKTQIKDLLAYSRVDQQKSTWHETNLYLTLQQAIANLQSEIEANKVKIDYEPNFPVLIVDDSQLVVLWQNIIENSIKYRRPEPLVIEIKIASQPDYWQFSVADNGIGLEAQYQQRIFQIFQRLHTQDEYPGNGIGLAICQKIVERHGGKIWVQSQLGRGSSFFFTIPRRSYSLN